MPIIGFNYDKLVAEKKKKLKPPLKIKTNISINDVKEEKSTTVAKGESLLRLDFLYKLDYGDMASVEVGGHIHYLLDDIDAKEVVKEWKKEKKFNKTHGKFVKEVYNMALIKCAVKALLLAQEVNLPPHIQLPTIKA